MCVSGHVKDRGGGGVSVVFFAGICTENSKETVIFHKRKSNILFSDVKRQMSQCMRFPTMWYVRPAKTQSLC